MTVARPITESELSSSEINANGMQREFSSFRDPSGFLVWRGEEIFRCVGLGYKRQFQHATESGLYTKLVRDGLLLPFTETGNIFGFPECHTVLKPTLVSQITYPYEWCFEQLKDAAILTLQAHSRALEHGMVLKDASAYNVQMLGAGRPRLIDHLSFDFLADHGAWPAYGQFCRNFLAPLALMSYTDASLGRLMQIYIDGIPLDLASRLLPLPTKFRLGLQMHVHLHAKMISSYGRSETKVKYRSLSREQMMAVACSLERTVHRLEPNKRKTNWSDYALCSGYTSSGIEAKLTAVRGMVERVKPSVIWDIGGNDGTYSRPLSDCVERIICMDTDPVAVNRNYALCRNAHIGNVFPMIVDFTSPSPGIGFANRERLSLEGRGKPDLVMALALIHHLSITHNLPMSYIASYLAELCRHLIIEFVPPNDPQVRRLVLNRKQIHNDYTEDSFRSIFGRHFSTLQELSVSNTDRRLFLMHRKACDAPNLGG